MCQKKKIVENIFCVDDKPFSREIKNFQPLSAESPNSYFITTGDIYENFLYKGEEVKAWRNGQMCDEYFYSNFVTFLNIHMILLIKILIVPIYFWLYHIAFI